MKIYKQQLEVDEFAQMDHTADEENDPDGNDSDPETTPPVSRNATPIEENVEEEQEEDLDLEFDEINIAKPQKTQTRGKSVDDIAKPQKTQVRETPIDDISHTRNAPPQPPKQPAPSQQQSKQPAAAATKDNSLSDFNFDESDFKPAKPQPPKQPAPQPQTASNQPTSQTQNAKQQPSKAANTVQNKVIVEPQKPLSTEKPISQAPKMPVDASLQNTQQETKSSVDFKKASPSLVKSQAKSEVPPEPIKKDLPTFETFDESKAVESHTDFDMNDMKSIFGNVADVVGIENQDLGEAMESEMQSKETKVPSERKTPLSEADQEELESDAKHPARAASKEDAQEDHDIRAENSGKRHFEMHEIDIRSFILYHKKHIIAIFAVLIVVLIGIYVGTVGVNVGSKIDFGSRAIKFESAEKVKVKYGFGKDIFIDNAKFQILPQQGIVLDVMCDIEVEAGLFSAFTGALSRSAVRLQNGTITINRGADLPAVHTIVMQMIESQNSSSNIFSRLSLSNMRVIVKEDGNTVDTFMVADLLLRKMPDVTSAKGVLKVSEHTMNISYEYYDKQHINNAEKDQNFFFSLKSPIFEFAATGVRELYGTASKSSSIKGDIEFSIRSVSQFVSLFERSKSITKYFLNFPQITGKSKFEYSSTGDLMKIYDGKASILDSIAAFSLETTDAAKDYKLTLGFDSFKLDQLFSHIKIISETAMNPTAARNNNDGDRPDPENINFFSVIGNGKTLTVDLRAKELVMQKATYFQDLSADISIANNTVKLRNFEMLTVNGLAFKALGEFNNTNYANRTGVFSFNMNGSADAYNIAKNTIEFITRIPLSKQLAEPEKIDLDAGLFIRGSAVILHDIVLKVKDVMEVTGMVQHTRRESEKRPLVYNLYDMTFSNLDLGRLKTDLLNFKQGSVLFQEVVNKNNTNSEYIYRFKNAQLGDNTINDSTMSVSSQDSNLEVGFDIDSSRYLMSGSISVDIAKQQPVFMAKLILNNVSEWSVLHENLKSIFVNNYIFLPSLSKFGGFVNIVVNNAKIFGEVVPNITVGGPVTNGVWRFDEAIFASQTTDKDPLTGKISGKVDLSYNVPIFNLQASMLNAQVKEFQKILPIKREFEGTISGGGSFSFSGLSYTEFLSSLKMKAKFILQKTKLPRLGLNFLAKNLLETHASKLFEFDRTFIESNIESSNDTEYNIVFSMVGENKAFTIDSCNLKTAYVAGVCAGVVNVLDGNNISAEIISKYVVPALDINKGLKDVMKLNISNKTKYNSTGEGETFTTDLSQVYQYINYRRATFGV